MLNKKAFTLVEILVVIIIVGILAALALPGYNRTKELTLDREAKSILALIQGAEKIYRMETGDYYTSAVIADVNTNLKVYLPTTAASWDYTVTNTQSTASRKPSNSRVWTLTHTGSTTTCTGTCL